MNSKGETDKSSYILFDKGSNGTNSPDHKLDVDVIYGDMWATPDSYNADDLKIDGTDSNNDGLIDGVDFNSNGVVENWGLDGSITLSGDKLYATELNTLLDNAPSKNMIILIHACFSGGFIRHISAPGRVVMTATQDRYWGYAGDGFHFLDGFVVEGGFMNADSNRDGHVTMTELYNFAYSQDNPTTCHSSGTLDEYTCSSYSLPQFNDTGDGKMYNAEDGFSGVAGCFGNFITLNGLLNKTVSNLSVTTAVEVASPRVTTENVTVKPTGKLIVHHAKDVAGKVILNSLKIEKGGTLKIDQDICN